MLKNTEKLPHYILSLANEEETLMFFTAFLRKSQKVVMALFMSVFNWKSFKKPKLDI